MLYCSLLRNWNISYSGHILLPGFGPLDAILPLYLEQRFSSGSPLKYRWSYVENETKFDVEFQCCTRLIQHRSMTLKQRGRAVLKKVRHFTNQEWEKKLKIYDFQFLRKNTVLETADTQFFKTSTLHHKMTRLGGGGLLQRLFVKIFSNIRYTITQNHCW